MGWPRPLELAEQLTLKDFNLWVRYAELEPFGEERGDWRAALIAYHVWALPFRLSGKRPPGNVKPEDFLVVPPVGRGSRSAKVSSVEGMQALFAGLRGQMDEHERQRNER